MADYSTLFGRGSWKCKLTMAIAPIALTRFDPEHANTHIHEIRR